MADTGRVPAPGLQEVAATRWDVDGVPDITWGGNPTTFWLVDPGDEHNRVGLLALGDVPADAAAIAQALAETVAACDFPPTDDHASQPRVAAALRVTGHADLALQPFPPDPDAPGHP